MSQLPPEPDPNKTAPMQRGDDTAPLDERTVEQLTVEAAEEALQKAAKGSTNIDTLVGRLVIEQGLATAADVQQCLAARESAGDDARNQSLAQALVDNQYITKRQLARLKERIEAERSGQAIPGYQILKKLGAGAMATVFKAKQLSLDRIVAIKILPKKYSNNPQFIERFYAEGRAAGQLNHPNIVQAFDVGQHRDTYYFVMEYVDGRTVHDDIVEHKRYSEKEALEIIIQVAEGLEHAHKRGLVHRDIKPKNLMISKEGVVKVADMGLARAISDKEAAEAEKGKAFGTPYYISPEQIRGEMNIGPPADIYSLGATMYHMVTGTVPFEGKNPSAVMHKHLKAELVPPDHVNPKLSAGISEIIEMMMAKKPENRYQTCTDLLVDLRAVIKGENPPIAHKEIVAQDDLAQLAALEAEAQTELATDKSQPESRPGLQELMMEPLFLILIGMFVISVALNLVQWLGGL
ncbi:MAG: serine/threonine protein kinase [Planctomycetota bacterium]|nr:MAG: serine/threonine protein kinase [Planctomycetota bacterium]